MNTRRTFLKLGVITWALILAAVFIGGTVAVTMLGTKSNATFKSVQQLTPAGGKPTRSSPEALDAVPAAASQPSTGPQ